jgi:hypothetical protein
MRRGVDKLLVHILCMFVTFRSGYCFSSVAFSTQSRTFDRVTRQNWKSSSLFFTTTSFFEEELEDEDLLRWEQMYNGGR